ncbi:hypothetical protein L7F22_049827 [Adiantum nelumboides]|nr:hypothetical protein [Adiantum nelumboides]
MPCHEQKWVEAFQDNKKPVGSEVMEALRERRADSVRFADDEVGVDGEPANMASLGTREMTQRRSRRRKSHDARRCNGIVASAETKPAELGGGRTDELYNFLDLPNEKCDIYAPALQMYKAKKKKKVTLMRIAKL